MYLEYFVRLPPEAQLRNCRDARALLARLHEQAEAKDQFDLRLLHLVKPGQPQHAPASIRIGRRGRSFVISAVGTEAVECLMGNASKAGALLAHHFNVALEENIRHGECNVQITPRVCTYRVPSLVLLRRNFERVSNGICFRTILSENRYEHPALVDQVNRIITEGIERQASVCLLDLPTLLLGDIQVHRLAPVLVKPGVYFLVGAVSFRAGLSFTGPWHAGYLQSRGFGRIFAAPSTLVARE